MKKYLLSLFFVLIMTFPVFAQMMGSAPTIIPSSSCSWLTWYGTLCHDTDDGKIYKWNGATQVELAAGGAGDVTAASNSQTWGSGAAATIPWTFNVSGTDTTFTPGNGTFIFSHPILLPTGSAAAPSLALTSNPDVGFYDYWAGTIAYVGGGSAILFRLSSDTLTLGATNRLAWGSSGVDTPDILLLRDAANTLALKRGTNLQKFNIYNTYTDASNYERFALTGVAGASLNLTAETAGTGGDNLNIILTPAGTGQVQLGSAKYPSTGGTAGKVLRSDGTDFASSSYTIALPTTSGQLLKADGTNWTASSSITGVTIGGFTASKALCSDGSGNAVACANLTDVVGGETYGYQSWSSGGLIPDTCSGLLQYKATNNQFDYLAFDGATDEYATLVWFPPDNWDRGTILAKFIWAAGAAMTNGHTVIWGLAGATVSDGITLANALTTGEQVISDAYATGDETGPLQKITAKTPAITIAGTHAVGNPVYFRVHRDADTDTSTVDAWLIGVRIQFTKTTETAW